MGIETEKFAQRWKLSQGDFAPGKHLAQEQYGFARHGDAVTLADHIRGGRAGADADGDAARSGEMGERSEARCQVYRGACPGMGHRRAYLAVGLAENRREDDKDIFVGEMVGNPKLIETMAGERHFCEARHFGCTAGWV